MSRRDVNKMSRVELSGSGSAIVIASIPCQFHAPNYHLLDQLFVPLLSCAQEANDVMALRVGNHKSALRAASYLAGELLRDKSFTPVRTLPASASHAYLVDLLGNNFRADTSVYTTTGQKASAFRVNVVGAIRGDTFVVQDPLTSATLFSFTRFEAEKPDFFLRDFPFLAEQSRKDPAKLAAAQDAKDPAKLAAGQDALAQGVIDIILGVPVGEKTIMVRVQKQPDASSVEVRHYPTNATIMSMPLATLGNWSKLIETIGTQLSSNPTAYDQ